MGKAPCMLRLVITLYLLSLILGCGGGSGQHEASGLDQELEGRGDHHGDHHSGEHKEAHGGGVHKHKHGGADDHIKHDHGKPLGHRFENAEEWAKRFDDPKRGEWQMPAHVVSLMEIEPGMQVADIGAGTGYFLPYLAAKTGAAGKVEGLDIEPDMVRYMNERAGREKLANVSARIVATDDPGLALASLDRVLIVNTWHHVPARVAYARKLAAGLKPGGTLTFVEFTMETKRGPSLSHRLTADSILSELRAAGLKAEILSENLPDQFVVRARKK